MESNVSTTLENTGREPQVGQRSSRPWLTALRRSGRTKAGLVLVVVIVVAAFLSPVISPYDPTWGDYDRVLNRPSPHHLFGTDNFGRDILSRVLYGYRVSMIVAIGSVLIALLIGLPLGLLAGYLGGFIDDLIMRPLDLLMAFPAILLAVTLVALFGTGTFIVCVALAIIYIPIFARILRGSVIALRSEEYVEAARTLGASPLRVMLRHILPNSVGPLIVQASISMGIAILIEAALSFVGLGTQPPHPSLGLMLSEGREYMRGAPWIVIFPGLAIMVAVLGFNMLGDGLRDLIDFSGRS